MTELIRSLQLEFMQLALAAGLLVGCTCAWLGVYLILKRIVFVGVALSQVSAVGFALGLFLQGLVPHDHGGVEHDAIAWVVSFTVTFGGVVAFWLPWAERRISKESILGYAYAAAAALSVLIIAKNPGGELQDLDLLSGNLLFVNGRDVLLVAGVCLTVCLVHAVLWKEFVFVSLDRDTARTLGLPARLYDFLIYMSIGATISVAMHRVGVLFVFASLILPALTGLLVASRLVTAVLTAVGSAAVGVTAGLLLSFQFDLPTGPAVVLCYAVLCLAGAGISALRR